MYIYIINVVRFTTLSIRNFSPMTFSQEYFHGALANSGYYLNVTKHSWEKFCGTLKIMPVLAKQIFPHLQCTDNLNVHGAIHHVY